MPLAPTTRPVSRVLHDEQVGLAAGPVGDVLKAPCGSWDPPRQQFAVLGQGGEPDAGPAGQFEQRAQVVSTKWGE